jgi:hypothetical protein
MRRDVLIAFSVPGAVRPDRRKDRGQVLARHGKGQGNDARETHRERFIPVLAIRFKVREIGY